MWGKFSPKQAWSSMNGEKYSNVLSDVASNGLSIDTL